MYKKKLLENEGEKNTGKKIDEFSKYFNKLWRVSKPIVKMFHNDSIGYLYDTGTNKILRCNEVEFNLLDKLMLFNIEQATNKILLKYGREQFINAAQNIVSTIEKEKILLTKPASQFGLSAHYSNFEELINTSLGQILLETTEKCNLRCDYCIYNPGVVDKRNHGQREMSLLTAYAAIDYLANHSTSKNDVSVSFYGGEPLLRFPFIKSCVNYAYHKILNKELRFSITTNGTLLTPEIANYFKNNNISIAVSIDGPEHIHDSFRKDIKGKGSFEQSLIGLRNLLDAYEEDYQKLSLSMVYTPPYSEKRIGQVANLWEEIPWIPTDIPISITYPHLGSIPREKIPKR